VLAGFDKLSPNGKANGVGFVGLAVYS
jgi:hypothetical protein